ncbi:hypothetical protein C8J32_1035 [Rhizobium sp. PP-CC-3A-592]|nr:hypothetical protein C8J32_1035 [Rhizobium sp. PP-CC-3A-592]
MKKQPSQTGRITQPSKLTSARGEKISAVEGMSLSARMRAVLNQSQDNSGDERRALVCQQFIKVKT